MRPLGSDSQHLCQVLGISRPVLLAPMAGVAGGYLARAVSNAGGLGLIGGGYGNPDWIAAEVAKAEGTRIGIGLITWNMGPDVVRSALEHSPAAVFLSFGDPTSHLKTIKAAGVLAICQVGSVVEAKQAIDGGADVVVAQGAGAGGHGPVSQPLAALVSQISAAYPHTPLVAAGGIADRADFEHYRSLGAAGVSLGTALYATNEAIDSPAAKERLVQATASDTIRSSVYDLIRGPEWPSGWNGRCLKTELTDTWAGIEEDMRPVLPAIKESYKQAVDRQDLGVRVIWAGRGVGKIERIGPASDLLEQFGSAL